MLDGCAYMVIELQHVKPGKGAAFVRSKLRDLKTSAIISKTFKGDEKIDEAFVEEKKLQYLYHKDDVYHFMDQQTFEELILSENMLKDKAMFLKDNLEVTAFVYAGEVLNINLPTFIDFKIVYTETVTRGDTVKAGTKPATIESGAVIQVPLFIQTGDTIKVDTRINVYVERANI